MSIEGIVALMTCFQLESVGSRQLNHMQYSPEAGLQLCANVFASQEATALGKLLLLGFTLCSSQSVLHCVNLQQCSTLQPKAGGNSDVAYCFVACSCVGMDHQSI